MFLKESLGKNFKDPTKSLKKLVSTLFRLYEKWKLYGFMGKGASSEVFLLRLQTHDIFSLGPSLEPLMLLNPGELESHRKRIHIGYGSKPTECRQGDDDSV